MADLVAALDQGTTSTRCMLFDREGQVVGAAQREHRQILPQAGWVEHDPVEILASANAMVREALAAGGHGTSDLVALGITNQRETVVIWNRETGEPYTNAIVWQDTRTASLCDELGRSEGPDRFRARTGLPLATYFSGPKIAWALEHVPGLRAEAERGRALCGTIDSWLVWCLTGGPDGGLHVTDATNASRTLLMDLRTLQWDAEILDTMRIPASMLPRIVSTSDAEAFGSTNARGPFDGSVPICSAVGDQQAALIGQGCFEPGDAQCTYGTGAFLLANTGTEPATSPSGLLTTVAYQVGSSPPRYALEGSIAFAGSMIQWLRDQLGLIETSPDVEPLARTVEDNGGVYFVPAFSGLFAPHWRADARGTICGLTRFANKGHIARAALEAVGYQTHDVLTALRADSGLPVASLRVGGGMVANELLMQLLSDILAIPVHLPANLEMTAFGAAYAAGLARGFYPPPAEHAAARPPARTFEPDLDEPARTALLGQWRKALDRSLGWID